MPTQATSTGDTYEVSEPTSTDYPYDPQSVTQAAVDDYVNRRTIRSDDGVDVCLDRVEHVMVIPSFHCNARCEFCCNHLEPTGVAAAKRDLQLGRFERAIRTIHPLLPTCVYSLSGGEVSTVPHLEDVLLCMRSIGVEVLGIMTNGRMHERLVSVAPLVRSICLSRHHPDASKNARFFGRERPWMSKRGLVEFAAAVKAAGSQFDMNAMVARGALDEEKAIGDLVDLSLNVGVVNLRLFDPFIADVALTPMVPAYRKWYREYVIPDAHDLVRRSLRAMGIEITMHERGGAEGVQTWGKCWKGSTTISFQRDSVIGFSPDLKHPKEITIAPDGSIRIGLMRCDHVLLSGESVDRLSPPPSP